MNNLPANYNGFGRQGFFARARALVTGKSGGSSTPSAPAIPANTLGGTTAQFDAYAVRLRGRSHKYRDGYRTEVDDKSLKEDHYLSPKTFDWRNERAKSHAPLFSLNRYVGLASFGNEAWDFKDNFLELASKPKVNVPSPGSEIMKEWRYDVDMGEITDNGVGDYELARVVLQVTAIDKSNLIPFARQVIDHSISNKLDAQEKRLLGYVRTENEPLALPNYSQDLKSLYVFVSPVKEVSDHATLSRVRQHILFHKVFNILPDAARFAYENKSQDFSLLEIFTLNVIQAALPSALQAELIAARAYATLSSDEKLYMTEQKIVRETRMRNRYMKIAAYQGADEAQDTVKSNYIWLTIDKSEKLRGTVVAGKYTNRTLHDMTGAELFDLYAECQSDHDSKGLCEIYLDYISPRGWRKTQQDDFEKAASEMTLDQAYSELGIDAKTKSAEVKNAYRRMVKKTHPDRGGDEWQLDRVVQAMNKIRNNRPDLHL